LEHERYTRLFALYMTASLIWIFYMERTALLLCDCASTIKAAGATTMYLLPTLLYIPAMLAFIALLRDPSLIHKQRYLTVLAYALALFTTAWVSPDMFEGTLLNIGYDVTTSLLVLLYQLVYPIWYLAYAYLLYKTLDPLFEGVTASTVSPKTYRILNWLAGATAVVFLALGLTWGLLGGYTVRALIIPGLGLAALAFWRPIREKPYRVFLVLPLFGQAAGVRATFFDAEVQNLLLYPLDVDIHYVTGTIAFLSLFRWALFLLPGFGGAHASMPLYNYFVYKKYRELGYDILVYSEVPPGFVSPVWLLAEVMIFYKSTKHVKLKNE